MFEDRTDAGRQIADFLEGRGIEADIVLGIPRGALPVARPVADALGVPLDVVVASKIGAPNNPELAVGAVASDGTAWLNEALIDRLNVADGYLEREHRREEANARRKIERYRGERAPPDLAGERVVVVDDGVATGATARACLKQAYAAGAERAILAVPVGSPDAVADLREAADEVLAVESPPGFSAVGQFYERFDQVSDEEALTYLDSE
jgi:predicted phosphoribosyltransferase